MDPINRYSLEDFTERHRADFDLHEPRPELWEVLAKQLEDEAASKGSIPQMSIVAGELLTATPPQMPAAQTARPNALAPGLPRPRTSQRGRWQWVGVAAALTVLVLAAGFGEFWKTQHPIASANKSAADARRGTESETELYLNSDAGVVPASQGGPNGNARLDTAVHGMERYYASQLADRQAQLSQLAPEQVAEWAQDITELDSIYQQLKRELPQHPQPEVVLTAMNRNLQTRLDILDQQLELRGGDQLAQGTTGSSEYALADSRSVADNVRVHHAR